MYVAYATTLFRCHHTLQQCWQWDSITTCVLQPLNLVMVMGNKYERVNHFYLILKAQANLPPSSFLSSHFHVQSMQMREAASFQSLKPDQL